MTDPKFALFAKIKNILEEERVSLNKWSKPIPWTFVDAEEEDPIRAVTTGDVHASLLEIQRKIAEAIKDTL